MLIISGLSLSTLGGGGGGGGDSGGGGKFCVTRTKVIFLFPTGDMKELHSRSLRVVHSFHFFCIRHHIHCKG